MNVKLGERDCSVEDLFKARHYIVFRGNTSH